MVVDDHPVVREGICQIIEEMPGFSVEWQHDDAGGALAKLESVTPDMVITDISLPGSCGLELIKKMVALREGLHILVVSMHDESLYAERVLKAGARGYITKDQPARLICEAVRKVASGEIYLSPPMAAQILESISGSSRNQRVGVSTLSDRQLQIFRLIGEGRRTADIAKNLHISVKTVETHRDKYPRAPRHRRFLRAEALCRPVAGVAPGGPDGSGRALRDSVIGGLASGDQRLRSPWQSSLNPPWLSTLIPKSLSSRQKASTGRSFGRQRSG